MILDVRLPDMSGLDAYGLIREIDPRLPVIIITSYTTTETAIEAMKRGAFEYLLKPLDLHRLRNVGRPVYPEEKKRSLEGPSTLKRKNEPGRLVYREEKTSLDGPSTLKIRSSSVLVDGR